MTSNTLNPCACAYSLRASNPVSARARLAFFKPMAIVQILYVFIVFSFVVGYRLDKPRKAYLACDYLIAVMNSAKALVLKNARCAHNPSYPRLPFAYSNKTSL